MIMKKNRRKKKIISVVTKWLILAVSVACVLSMVFIYLFLYERTQNDVYKLLEQNSHDLINDVYRQTDKDYLWNRVGHYQAEIATANLKYPEILNADFEEHSDEYDEYSVINNEGKITASSESELCGENVLTSNKKNYEGVARVLKDYLKRKDSLKKVSVLISYGDSEELSMALDGKRKLYYYGMSMQDWSGVIVYGVNQELYDNNCDAESTEIATYRHIGREGYMLVVGRDDLIIYGGTEGARYAESFPHPELVSDMVEVDYQMEREGEKITRGRADFYGVPSYYAISGIKNTLVVAVYPVSEAHESMDRTLRYTLATEIAVFLVLFILILLLEKKFVINDIHRVNETLNSITQGDLEAKADVRRTYEFDALSTDINTTVDKLKLLIKEAEERIDEELALAAKIQLSFIPHEFPPFPDRDEFELYASMIPAKEVGGDFYDYFFVDEDHLALVMADVSGKGIPAAMFMVMTKDELRHSVMKHGTDVAEAVREVNLELIKENDAGLFVTVWLGVLTVSTGHVDYVNAGHEYPAISHAGDEFVADEDEHSIPLAARKKAKFDAGSFILSPGDILYLYTDGVTEANDSEGEMFRRSRMLEALNSDREASVQDIDDNVRKAVADFVQDAPQFDDTTTLCLRYKGK